MIRDIKNSVNKKPNKHERFYGNVYKDISLQQSYHIKMKSLGPGTLIKKKGKNGKSFNPLDLLHTDDIWHLPLNMTLENIAIKGEIAQNEQFHL